MTDEPQTQAMDYIEVNLGFDGASFNLVTIACSAGVDVPSVSQVRGGMIQRLRTLTFLPKDGPLFVECPEHGTYLGLLREPTPPPSLGSQHSASVLLIRVDVAPDATETFRPDEGHST